MAERTLTETVRRVGRVLEMAVALTLAAAISVIFLDGA
jgi:hypothetical protein